MILDPTKLTERVTFQRQVETVLPSGGVTTVWTEMASVRAEVRDLTADEIAAGRGEKRGVRDPMAPGTCLAGNLRPAHVQRARLTPTSRARIGSNASEDDSDNPLAV